MACASSLISPTRRWRSSLKLCSSLVSCSPVCSFRAAMNLWRHTTATRAHSCDTWPRDIQCTYYRLHLCNKYMLKDKVHTILSVHVYNSIMRNCGHLSASCDNSSWKRDVCSACWSSSSSMSFFFASTHACFLSKSCWWDIDIIDTLVIISTFLFDRN